MALSDPSAEIQATLTDQARQLIARACLGDVVFKVVGFGLGRGGYDPLNVVDIVPIVPTATELDDKVFPDSTAFTYEDFISTEEPTATVRVYNCRVEAAINPGNADFGLGELSLYAEIVNSSVPAEIGTIVLYAISHFPIVCKTRRDTFLRRVVVTY